MGFCADPDGVSLVDEGMVSDFVDLFEDREDEREGGGNGVGDRCRRASLRSSFLCSFRKASTMGRICPRNPSFCIM